MGWIITGIILMAIGFGCLGFKEVEVEKATRYGGVERVKEFKWKFNLMQLFSLLFLLFCIPSFVSKVPANSVGIVYSAFTGTSEDTLGEGFHSKNPFEKIYKISTEVQTKTMEGLTTQTQDAQYVTSTLDIKYRVSPSNAYLVFKQFRTLDNMSSKLIVPTTQRILELITTKYDVMDILGGERSAVYSELEASLATEFAKYGVEFYSISITDMDAGDAIEAAITKQAIAKKEVETAEQELLKAQTEAKKKSVTAQAEQDAAKIQAETKAIQAKAEKEANELLNNSLTDSILRQQWIEKWNGVVPTYYGGNGTDLIFNTGN